MKRAAIVSPLRTPIGAFGGALKSIPVEQLGATVARAVVEKAGLDPARIEDVVFAQSYMNRRCRDGRWRREHEQCRVLHDQHALGQPRWKRQVS